MNNLLKKLTLEALHEGVEFLTAKDSDFQKIVARHGPPPLWQREEGFETLVYIILEQQVSLASARAAFQKLKARLPQVNPAEFLSLNDADLKQIGFSRQKMKYSRNLARAILDTQLNLEALPSIDNDAVRSELTRLNGIGRWTADIYLMEALLRPDVWPATDLALVNALQRIKQMDTKPSIDEVEKLGYSWKPWRAVAARIIWHAYLNGYQG